MPSTSEPGRPGRAGPVLTAVLAALLAAACVSEPEQAPPTEWTFTSDEPAVSVSPLLTPEPPPSDDDLLRLLQPATAADLGPATGPAGLTPSDLGPNVVRGIDGSWTKRYVLRSGRGGSVVELLRTYLPEFPAEAGASWPPDGRPEEVVRWVLQADFYSDETSNTLGDRQAIVGRNIADVLHVTAPPETLLYIDELLHKILADVPQIELEVRVVEINLDDTIEWDTSVLVTQLENAGEPFDPLLNPLTGKFGAGVPILVDGQPSGAGAGFSSTGAGGSGQSLPGFLLSLQGIHDNLAVDAILSLLQTVGTAEIISSPTITVLNGHHARLITGDRVPVFEATGTVNNANVSTRFEDIGVTIDMIPFIVADDLVRIDVSVSVSAQTGSVPYNISGTEVVSPIISQRSAGTTLHVYGDQVFALGGLKSSRQLDTVTKVPLLGDIPILGWLFKSRQSQKVSSEILFFVTPKIHIPSGTLIRPVLP